MVALLSEDQQPQARQSLSEESDLVGRYLTNQDPDILDSVIAMNLGYVHAIAVQVSRSAPPVLDIQDLEQCGRLGLLSAVHRYKPELGIPFHNWAYKKIRGAMMDAIRRASNTSRTRNVHWVSLNDVYQTEDSSAVFEHGLSPKASQAIRAAVLGLPLRQAVVVLLSLNGLPVPKIASITDTSTSQVQQDKRTAMASLRDQLVEFLGEIV